MATLQVADKPTLDDIKKKVDLIRAAAGGMRYPNVSAVQADAEVSIKGQGVATFMSTGLHNISRLFVDGVDMKNDTKFNRLASATVIRFYKSFNALINDSSGVWIIQLAD